MFVPEKWPCRYFPPGYHSTSLAHCPKQDFFESHGITRGGRLGYVLTKVKLGPNGQLPFLFTTKSGTLEMGIPGVAWMGNAGKKSQNPAAEMTHTVPAMKAYYEAMTRGFSPILLCPLGNPDGGYFDPSFHKYQDEYGDTHNDAIFLTVARTLFEPFVCDPKRGYDSPNDPGFGPVTDGSQAMRRMGFPGVLAYPLKDGYTSLL